MTELAHSCLQVGILASHSRPMRLVIHGPVLLALAVLAQSAEPLLSTNRYEFRQDHSPDGIGKFYREREIAHVMGHQAADWLERPERDEEEHTGILVDQLKLKTGDVV